MYIRYRAGSLREAPLVSIPVGGAFECTEMDFIAVRLVINMPLYFNII